MSNETVFTVEATPVKYGSGAADEAGWELKRLGVERALLVTDPGVAATGHPGRVRVAPALSDSSAARSFGGISVGRRLARSTKTCTNQPSAASSPAPRSRRPIS